MKYKKIMLVALILLAVLTISAVSASDDIASDGNLTVSDEEDSIDTSTDDVELLSQGDDGNVGVDDSFDVEVADEVDLADENAAIVNVSCPENAQGYIAVVVSGEDEDEDYFEFDPVYHQITDSDWNNNISWTASSLNITETFLYHINVYSANDMSGNYTKWLGYGSFTAWNSSEFHVEEFYGRPCMLYLDPVIVVYCPADGLGNVTITVRDEWNQTYTTKKAVADRDAKGMLNWTLDDLQIATYREGEYSVDVYLDAYDEYLEEDEDIFVNNPIQLKYPSYINATASNKALVMVVEVPSSYPDDTVISVSIEGESVFEMEISEFNYIGVADGLPYWDYFRHMGYIMDENSKFYYIGNTNFQDVELKEGSCYLKAVIKYGDDSHERNGWTYFINTNTVSKDNVTIEIYDEDSYDVYEDHDVVMVVTNNREKDGTVSITDEGSDWILEIPLGSYDKCPISSSAFFGLKTGWHNLTVSYYEEGQLIVESNATILFENDDPEFEPYIEVGYIDLEYPEDSFAFVTMDKKEGEFAIVAVLDDVYFTLFYANLSDWEHYDYDDDTEEFQFQFTFNDLNEFINDHYGATNGLLDLFENGTIIDGDLILFGVEYGDDKEKVNGYNIFYYEDEDWTSFYYNGDWEDEITVDYPSQVVVYGGFGWEQNRFIDIKAPKDFTGRAVIYVDGIEKVNKSLSEFVYKEADGNFIHYYLRFMDVNDTWERNVKIKLHFVIFDEDEEAESDEPAFEEYGSVVFFDNQINRTENVTIQINPANTIISDGDDFIFIRAEDVTGNVTVIIMAESDKKIELALTDCNYNIDLDEYSIGSELLGINTAGEYALNVTYGNVSLIGTARLISNINIDYDDTLYVGFGENPNIIMIRFVEGEIHRDKGLSGKVNVTLYDKSGENVIVTLQDDITNLYYHEGARAYVISYSDLASNDLLNGTFYVIAKYFDGSQADTQTNFILDLIPIDEDCFDVDVNAGKITNYTDSLFVFDKFPEANGAVVIKDGDYMLRIIWNFRDRFWDYDTGNAVITFDDLGPAIGNGKYNLSVYYYDDYLEESLFLASGEFEIDIEGNDKDSPGLSIGPISNVEQGNDVEIVIKADEEFWGTVSVQVGNVNTTADVFNGRGTVHVSTAGMATGVVPVKVTFAENPYFLSDSASTTFNLVPKTPPSPPAPVIDISGKNVAFAYSYSGKYVVTVTSNGNPLAGVDVAIKFNGATKVVKTNSKGQAILTIKNNKLKPKKYTITASYGGKTIKNTVTVKQILKSSNKKIKKSAKKLVLKATLKNGKKPIKGKVIKFKFKGKTYKAKTNKKGIAKVTIKKKVIKKLKKGKKYAVKITYLKDTIKKTVTVKK